LLYLRRHGEGVCGCGGHWPADCQHPTLCADVLNSPPGGYPGELHRRSRCRTGLLYPDLTSQRFIANPLRADSTNRMWCAGYPMVS
jgi:hypothetical protein